jgi:hypothetical protein
MDNLKVKLRRLRASWCDARRLSLARGDYDGAQAIARASHQDEIAERRYLCERIHELGGEIPLARGDYDGAHGRVLRNDRPSRH